MVLNVFLILIHPKVPPVSDFLLTQLPQFLSDLDRLCTFMILPSRWLATVPAVTALVDTLDPRSVL